MKKVKKKGKKKIILYPNIINQENVAFNKID